MATVVIAPAEAEAAGRDALTRALAVHPARVEVVARAERVRALLAAAAEPDCEWLIVVDADAVLAPDAFGTLRRLLAEAPGLVGGRALQGATQQLGAMFGPSRWGPAPAELLPVVLPLGQPVAAFRGPMDVPARGLLIVAPRLVRAAQVELDPVGLRLQLAAAAKLADLPALCEPALGFVVGDDPPDLLAQLPRVLAALPAELARRPLHRDPPVARERLIAREVRQLGNVRGYERRPYPPTSVLVVSDDGRVPRDAANRLAAAGLTDVAAIAPDATADLRAALGRAGERYLLVASPQRVPDRAAFVAAVERLERNATIALVVDAERPPVGCALFHLGRFCDPAALRGEQVWDLVADAARRGPERRQLVAGPQGPLVDGPLPPLPRPDRVDAVMLASGRPELTKQTLEALHQTELTGMCSVVTAAGAETTTRIAASWPELQLVADPTDPFLSFGLHAALASGGGDLVLVLRDDVQVPRGTVARMAAAFERVPGLAMALPRGGSGPHPEALPDIRYRDMQAMQGFADRRAETHAREVTLVDSASLPIALIARRAFDLVGGFEPVAGFSRWGIADFARRLRSANCRVAVCDDAYVHLFAIEDSHSLLQRNDAAPHLRQSFEARWAARRGFDPERDVVPFPTPPPPAASIRLHVLVPLRDADEWQRVAPQLEAFAAAFGAGDPVEVAIGIDGELPLSAVVGEVRDLLARSPRPVEASLNVRIEAAADLAAWRATFTDAVRLTGFERAELAALRVVADAAEAADLLRASVP